MSLNVERLNTARKPACNSQNMLAFARAHVADRSDPLHSAMHADASSRHAAIESAEQCVRSSYRDSGGARDSFTLVVDPRCRCGTAEGVQSRRARVIEE
eukprot:6197588-Pleurochrysis_carterae.AAC.6